METSQASAGERFLQHARKLLGADADLIGGFGEHAQGGDFAARVLGVQVEAQCGLERGERHLVEAQRTGEGIFLQARDQRLRTDDDARLGAAEQLIA